MGVEFFITLFAALAALWKKGDALAFSLATAWLMSFATALTVKASLIPLTASLLDVFIALCALALWHVHDSQRARIVASISLLKLLFHFGISAQFGSGDWYVYALLVNTCFVMQCVVAGGWFYGVVDFLNRISPRHPDRHSSSHKKRTP